MKPLLAATLIAVMVVAGCSNQDRERQRERTARAEQKAHEEGQKIRQEARRLGAEARQEAHKLHSEVNRALQGAPESSRTAGNGASGKLDNAEREIGAAGHQAAAKLDQAALVAKVKAKLAEDVGLSSVMNVDVDVNGQVVTLTGTVSSEDQKRQAGNAVARVDGVSRVINDLQVKPQ